MRGLVAFILSLSALAAYCAPDEDSVARQALVDKLKKNCPNPNSSLCLDQNRRFARAWEKKAPATEMRTEEGRLVTWAQHRPAGFEYEVAILVSPGGETLVRKAWIRFASK